MDIVSGSQILELGTSAYGPFGRIDGIYLYSVIHLYSQITGAEANLTKRGR